MAKFGLIGKNISYSFSKKYFTQKFENEHKKHSYHNFDISTIEAFPTLLKENPDLKGLNVTIPYKEAIIPFLDGIEKEAQTIGAVNTIKFLSNGKLMGYNTDHIGFAKALTPFLPLREKTALILGTGGASKAIYYVLKTMDFKILFVSRTKKENSITYNELTPDILSKHFLVVNTTPLGTYPKIEETPVIPYKAITSNHLLFDLTYNPEQTTFMKLGFLEKARVSNGLKMLEFQAEKACEIWGK